MIAGVSTGVQSGPEPKSLMTLVALASTLFDQQAALEEKCMVREAQQQSITKNIPNPQHPQQERQPSFSPQTRRHSAQRIAPSPSSFATKTAVTKHQPKRSIPKSNQNSPSKKNSIPQNNNFQCCTREGFLSKLFSVLNDESLSHVLSWMPDGKAFTIVSSREFSKSGMVYDLFGIRKMSSFLRRLNQLGFARVRDPTDPNNLDVFRKPGFMAQTAAETERKSLAKVAVLKRMDSPTSTLMFSPTMADEKSASHPLNVPSPESSSMSPRASSPVSISSTETNQARERSSSSDSDASSQWVCSTPEVSQAQGRLPSAGKGTNHILPLASMPPSIPIHPSGGPVLLRARSESYERSPPPAILAKPLLPPPKPIAYNKTPTATTNMISLKLSPGTFHTLELPNLGHASQSLSNAAHEIRPPPLEFVAECVRKLQSQEPMQVEGDDRPKSPFLGNVHVRALPKLQHVRDYIRLCEAAEKEADAILSGSLSPKEEEQQEFNLSPPPFDSSVLAHVELLQGYKRRKAYEVSSE